MTMFGHNNGPSLEPGQSWRRHCWSRARADLLPRLPIEILRTRVKRAKELGLEYKTYASVRASTGRDVVGFLFSSNALRSLVNAPKMPEERREILDHLTNCKRVALVASPLCIRDMARANPGLHGYYDAPGFLSGWGEIRHCIDGARQGQGLPADGVLLVGDMALEREWSVAGRLAGYLPADRFFQTRC